MKINHPLALNEQGRRDNQEDSVWPAVGTANEACRTFVVCDGMGGHESGEVASNAVCTALANYVVGHSRGPVSPAEVEQAISEAYDMLDRADRSASDRRMGTTLTLLSLTDSEAICAHIGDSRIYQVRPSVGGSASIVYKSSDHSLVNELVKAKVITPEEALTHPKKNVITRAMQSIEGRRDAATLRRTNDVASGDYFLLCTDGVTEAVSDQAICGILGNRAISDFEKLAEIKTLCLSASHDNFSLYLVPIAEGIQDGAIFDETAELMIHLPGEPPVQSEEAKTSTDGPEIVEAFDEEVVAELSPLERAPYSLSGHESFSRDNISGPKTPASNFRKKVALAAFGVLIICAVVYFLFAMPSKSSDAAKPQAATKVERHVGEPIKQTASEIKADAVPDGLDALGKDMTAPRGGNDAYNKSEKRNTYLRKPRYGESHKSPTNKESVTDNTLLSGDGTRGFSNPGDDSGD